MKKGWQTKKLGDLCEVFADGDWVESKDQSSDGIRLIQTGNVGNGVFKERVEKSRYVSDATFKQLRCTEIFEGDCLISRLPDPVGRSCILPETGERMITAVDCTIVRFDQKQLLPKFFNLYTQSDDYLSTVAKECTGTTRSRISRSNLALTPIPVPPLSEQQRIVRILDEAFDGLASATANAEQNLCNARGLFESHLQSVFTQRGEGWVDKRLGDVCKLYQGLAINQKTKHLLVSKSRLPLLRIKDLRDNTEEQYVSEKGFPPNALVNEDDILYTRTGNSLGLVFTGRRGVLHNNSFKIAPDLSLRKDYLFWWLQTPTLKERIFSLASKAAQPDITHVMFKNQPISVPPLKVQKVIIDQVVSLSFNVEKLEKIYRQKLAALGELKKSLLHQAFNGGLTKDNGQ
nr:restriction endonuclease subunit S [Nitrosomonas nitrosa]